MKSIILTCALLTAGLSVQNEPRVVTPTKDKPIILDGIQLRGYEAAISHIKSTKWLSADLKKPESYVVSFEGLDKEMLVYHFYPKPNGKSFQDPGVNLERSPLLVFVNSETFKVEKAFIG